VKTRTQVDAVNWAESTTFMDGLGRTIKTQTKDSQGDVFTETQYDNMGRITKTSNPYRDGEEKQWIETVYDEAGRVKEVISPKIANEAILAKIKSEYSFATTGNEIGIVIVGINQAGKKGRSITNALGQIIRVDELNDAGDLGPIDNPTQPTYYKYNPQGQMVKVTQGLQNRYFLYDSLGRLIRIRQSEQDVNPDLTLSDPITENNQWSSALTYDNNGNVLTSTDAKGVTINYAYDNANRVIQRSYSIPQTSDPKKITYSTSTVNFKYDGLLSPAPNNPNPTIVQYAKGVLTEISNGVSTTQNTGFDNLGRILSSQQITDGQVYPFTYKYDNISGVLLEEKYPSGRIVKNIYNNDSDLAAVSTRLPNESPRFRAGNFRYTSKGDVDQIQLGNGRWETYKYNTRNQVTERALGTSPTDTSLWKVNYDYGRFNTDGTIDVSKNDGNIIRQTITISGMANSFVQTYSYDSINRLIEAVETNGGQQTWRQTFGYDRYGNRTNFSQVIGQTQLELNNITHPTIDPLNNRFTAGQGYEYDFNGNLIQDAEGRKYSFDGDNKQREVKNSNNQTIATYSYDGSGRRIKKTVVSTQETTTFVYDAGGKLTGEYSTNPPQNGGTTKYLMNDSLNTPRVVTDQNGNVISRRDFLPFGEEIQVNTANRTADFKYGVADNVRQKFTGYQRDDETQLDFAEARYYNGKHGRFTAVDPLLASGKSMNPQTFNRYVYAGNNPTRRTDPNGQDWYTDDKFEIRNGVKVWVSRTYKWFNAPNMWIFGYGRVTNFLVNYNSGPALGLHVLNPWEGFQAKVSSESEAKAQINQWRKEAFLDFVVGALEAASFILEISGALDGTGVYRGSSYNLGYNSSTLVTSLKLLTGVGALDKALSVGAKMFGKDLLPLLKGAIKVCCFVAGTPIHTDKGLVPIEKIKVGDKVLSYNEKTKQFEYKQVAHTFIGTKENLVHIKIKGEKRLTTTTEHPFYVKKTHKARDSLSNGDDDEEGEWVEAGELEVGDKVLRSNGKWTRITRIEYEQKQITVYNFEVEGNHSYFVGDVGVLSHNCEGVKIALGIGDSLDDFAKSTGSKTWKELAPDALRWKEWFMDAMSNTKNTVVFNLDGVDNIWSSVQRAASGGGGATDWELLMIRQNSQWWDRIQFMRNGQSVANPFQ
jgi:RHS repeat-associated protein